MAQRTSFKIALIQMACAKEPEQNLRTAVEAVGEAARRGARVVCLPELFRSQYFCQREDVKVFDLAEPVPGPSVRALARIARRRRITVIAPIFERRAPGVYHNSAAVLGPSGKIIGLYRKMHIPDDPGYYEKFYFTPGDLGFQVFDSPAGRFAPLICWDQWYPEAARLVSLRGAHVIFYPTAIGWHPAEKRAFGRAQLEAWRTVQRAHAITNGVYVAAVNRVGLEKAHSSEAGIEFWGSSFIADPQGVVVAEASSKREEILIGEVDLRHLEEVRRHWPFWRDRRIDAYADLNQRFLDRPRGDGEKS